MSLPAAHEATRNPNGSWNVHDVPIFGEIPAKNPQGRPVITREWLESAVARDAERRAEGYTAPAHIHHTDGFSVPPRAGEMVLKDVRDAKYDGQDIAVVFADLQNIPNEVYQRIRAGELPYRSVEVFDIERPEINSVALLDSEVPFFRFPNLQIQTERPAARFSAARRITNSPVVAASKQRNGPARGYLFHAGALMDTTEHDDPIVEETPETPEVETFTADESDGEQFAEETPEVEAPSDEAVETAAERMFSLLESLAERVESFEARLDELSQMREPDITPDGPIEGDDINAATPEEPEKPEQFDAGGARLHGRLMALEEKLAQIEQEKVTEGRFKAALDRLEGYRLSDKSRDTLHRFAAIGQEELDTVVETFQESLPKFPPPSVDDATAELSDTDTRDEVSKYSDDPNKHARARALAAQYDLMKDRLSCSLGDFIDLNISRAPMAPAKED